jgi:O-acetyl-ADP-ribose deacetylase (regulator of RNase III)
MITYITGDLFDFKGDVIVHGCNCFKVMGSGVAKYVHEYYPAAYAADLNYGEYGDSNKLGTYSKWTGQHYKYKDKKITVINLYSQFGANPLQKPFDYNAFEVGFKQILKDYPTESIAMPKIGSGLAGGDWNRIESMINKISGDREIIIYVL